MTTSEIDTQALDAEREELIRRRLAGGRSGRRAAIPTAARTAPLPLSFGQQQMWFLNRLEPDSPEYLVPLALRISGALDPEALTTAWRRIVARHEILRTRYTLVDDRPCQVADEPADVDIPLLDLTSTTDRERALAAHADTAATTGFDLEREHPVRAGLVRLAADEHVLVLVFHHIAWDAWSTGVLAAELAECYRAARTGDVPALAALPVQFADFAAWERERSATAHQAHLDYWVEQLAGLEPLELPTDRPRPSVRDWRGEVVTFDLPTALADRARAVAAANDTTLFVTLLSAFQALLARYTGRTDVPVGTMVSGRNRPELQNLIGYGINSLVLRGRWSGDPTFTRLLADARATVFAAFDHQEVPFARLVDAVAPERDMSRTPLFQVAFTLHEAADDMFALSGVDSVRPLESGVSQVSRFDLTALVQESRDGTLRLQLEYATALFDRATIERLGEHFLRLLDAVTANPDTRLSDVALLDDEERAILLGASDGGDTADFAGDRGVAAVFEECVAALPDAVALVADGVELSYADLNARANRLAAYLRSLGVGRGDLVGVCLPRGLDLIPVLLGVLKSGAAYLPLDPGQPVDRLGFMVADADVAVVVTDSGRSELVTSFHGGPTVVVDRHAPIIAEFPDHDVDRGVGRDDLIYVIYTSGSTGRPKGVCLSHGNVLRLLGSAYRHYGFGSDDVWPLFHSYAFDVSVWEMWGALLHGGKLVIVPQDVTRSPDEFLDLLVAHRVTVLNQTPSAFKGLVALSRAGDPRMARLNLRAVVFAGEKLEMPELEPWTARFGVDRPMLINMYGITETTVHSTFYRVSADDVAGSANPIGRPLADLRIYVLDQDGNLAPTGVPGEIHVGGPGVARGYLNRPELTATRFVPDPFGATPGARLYRSGDLARRMADGSLEFLGRIDDQVKIRGFRVELGEIEAVLAAHQDVAEAAVVLRDEALVGYVVGAGVGPRELRDFVAGRLPEYMIPSAIVMLDKLPLTANGKLDRRALPAPGEGAYARGGYVAPATEAQRRVAGLFGELLPVTRVGVRDSFFDLGGNSILAVALVGRLRSAGFDVRVRDVFENRTVAELATVLENSAAAEDERLVEPFELLPEADRTRMPLGVVDAYPLSRVQTGMVVEMLASAELRAYHNVTTFRVRDDAPFDLAALRAAVATVTARHEVLRTSIDMESYSIPLQLVHADATMGVVHQDLRGRDDAGVEAAIREFTATERANLFDLTEPSLVRLGAHQCDGNVWWLSITECHAVIEGWTHHTLLMDILDAYRELRAGTTPAPVELPALRFADFIAAELRSIDSAEDRAYWQRVIDTYPRFTLPTGWGNGQDAPWSSANLMVSFADLVPDLKALAAAAGASMKSVLLAAHLKVLSQLTEQERFLTGLVLHGRPEVEGAERVYGMFLNCLPFGYDGTARTWRELVAAVFAQETGVFAHRRFPMPVIQQELAGGERLLDVRFSYHDFTMVDKELVDYAASIDDSPTEFPLAVLVRMGHVFLMANTRDLHPQSLDRIGAMYRTVLEEMAGDQDGDPRGTCLPLRERVLATVQPVHHGSRPVTETVLAGFHRQAAATPNAVAVTYGAVTVTYAELDTRANRIAHELRALGIGARHQVGVLVDRGPDLLAALLGTWKSGAAYVPFDPAFPAERMRDMLTTARATVVLTQSRYADRFSAIETVLLDDDRVDRHPAGRPAIVDTDLDELAYTIFTSGSTGRPKGVQVTHRGLANHVRWAVAELAGSGTAGAPLFSSVAFDLVVPNLYAPLLAGQRVAMIDQDVDLADLGRHLAEAGPFSFIKLTPGHLDMIAQGRTAGQAPLAEVLVVAGEPFTATTLRRWRATDPATRLINEYGPTEASVGTSVYAVPADPATDVLPIGTPLPGMKMYVLDGWLRPVPVGVVGELFVGGVGLARGYAHEPALTAAKFLPDPFGPVGSRIYRTGDLVRLLPDGNVAFVSRVDDQVKIRGYRVELGEIRTVLTEHPAVVDAAVVVHGDTRLVAYVVGDGPTPDELRAHAAARLPEYMVPALYLPVPTIPLNANGKLDRAALPAIDAPAATVVTETPRNEIEERIAAIWCTVLGLSEVGVHDNFFTIGGHSIRAVAVVGALRAAGFACGVPDVFKHRTIADLAEVLASRRPAEPRTTLAKPFEMLTSADRDRLPDGLVDAYPLSQVQLGMLVEMLGDPTANRYHNCNSFRVHDGHPFDGAAFMEAVALVVERHDILRTAVDLDGYSVPMQLVFADAEMPIRIDDLRTLDEDGFAAAMREFVTGERAHPLDLDRAPLQRLTVHVESDASWWLSVTVCHAITEGWSNRRIVAEILDCYRALRAGVDPELQARPEARYADFVKAELAALDSKTEWAYWQSVVDSHARFVLPADWGDAADGSFVTAVPFADLRPGLEKLADEAGGSLKSVLLGAHLAVLGRLTGDRAFYTGLVCSARPELPGAERVAGMYLNTLPFPFRDTASTWRELVAAVFATEGEVWRHRALPMPAIQRRVGVPRLLDVMFSYREFDAAETELTDRPTGVGEGAGSGANEFPLAVATVPGHLAFTVDGRVLSRANAERLGEMYRATLVAMAADPDGTTEIASAETEQMWAQWNDTAVEW